MVFSEDDLQTVIVEALRVTGYTVLVTTHRAKRCRKCGHFAHGGYGATKGIPDLLVSRPGWNSWVGLEIKKPGKAMWSSLEQKELFERGFNALVQSLEQAFGSVIQVFPDAPCPRNILPASGFAANG